MAWAFNLRLALAGLLLAAAAPVATAVPAPQRPAAKPQRIMSVNMCTDLLLLMLVPKERIASITFLARPAVAVLMPGADAGIATNHGTAEEAVRDRPDLILASPGSAGTLRSLAERTGARVADVDAAASFADIGRVTRQVGALVGEPARAEALVTRMDRSLARLAVTRPPRTIRVVAWSGGNAVPGGGTLTDAIIGAAGASNVAARFRNGRASSFGLEELLLARPDAILRGEDRYDAPAARDAETDHPLVARAFRGRQIAYPASAYACGVPQSADAAWQLRRALTAMPAGSVGW